MDLARSVYGRELKVSVMRAMDAGESGGRVARRFEISPQLIERWRAEWGARGEALFPGTGRRAGPKLPPGERTVADLERKIGQLTLVNDFLEKALQQFREHPPPAVVSGAAAYAARSSNPAKRVRPPDTAPTPACSADNSTPATRPLPASASPAFTRLMTSARLSSFLLNLVLPNLCSSSRRNSKRGHF